MRSLKKLYFKSDKEMQKTDYRIDQSLIQGNLHSLLPLSIQLVSNTDLELFWNYLVSQYHYLGYKNLLGRRLKYLVFSHDRPIAALSWSAPALKLRARDCYIGWSVNQRNLYINRLVNNSRFLIYPWVKVPHLASYILARNVRQLRGDWPKYIGPQLFLLETYVNSKRFKGTSYKAANWISLGPTSGYGKQGNTYIYHGIKKEIFVYVVTPHFRTLIGCQPKPFALFQRSAHLPREAETLQMIIRHANWHPTIVPAMNLNPDDIQVMADELTQFHQEFHDCFGRIEHRRLGMAYLTGLLSNGQEKSIEPMALNVLDEKSVRSLQRFMKTYRWDQVAMEKTHQTLLANLIASPEGMINVDSSEIAKKGKESVGVARQYCGALGKVENCQSGVFAGYSSEKGYGLLTSQLYMPKCWFTDEYKQRREENLVPEDLTFQTKPQIAQQLIHTIVNTGLFPAKWIGCDSTFGSDINFLHSLPEHLYYFANVRSNEKVFLANAKNEMTLADGKEPSSQNGHEEEPKAISVHAIAQSASLEWIPAVLDEGAKGPILAKVARLRVYPSREGVPEDDCVWLFFRCMENGEIKYAFSNAPEDISLPELCKASIMRWPIEQCFKDGKEQLGMDQYEHRSWPAWHRHMIYRSVQNKCIFPLT